MALSLYYWYNLSLFEAGKIFSEKNELFVYIPQVLFCLIKTMMFYLEIDYTVC